MRNQQRMTLVFVTVLSGTLALLFGYTPKPVTVQAQSSPTSSVHILYPQNGSVFPPEIPAPTVLWQDQDHAAHSWQIEVRFADDTPAMHFVSDGPLPEVAPVDPQAISTSNELPRLNEAMSTAHAWQPNKADWERIKQHSTHAPATLLIRSQGAAGTHSDAPWSLVLLSTSTDPVGAPIFYRDVPLMPSETEKGIIKPLAASAVPLIRWRLRSVDKTESSTVMTGIHTCANCHSFSANGKVMGIDMDGPRNDKGLYAVAEVRPQMSIRSEEMVNWNPTQQGQFAANRVAFMSQISPTGRYILSTVTRPDRSAENNYYVANFRDYRFLQVFYPTRGVLAWFDRNTGQREPLPGADDPHFVQTDGVWSPDGKWIVFARAEAKEPYTAHAPIAAQANDPNETQIRYSLYRIPFNNGHGGIAEPIEGASNNGMSNSFPKISPDGRWIVFVKARNGQLMRPDSELYIVPFAGGQARRMNCNMTPMNSWHSWSPNGHWMVFSSKSRGPYTRMYLTHIDAAGNDSPAIYLDNTAAANRAVNLPEFVNIPADGIEHIATPAVEMYRQFDHAVELSEKGNHSQALQIWKELASAHPEDARVESSLADTLMHLNQPGEAAQHYRRALQLNPLNIPVHASIANAEQKAGHPDAALDEYKTALRITPQNASLLSSYGSLLGRTGHSQEAFDACQKAVQMDPELAEAHNNLGILYAHAQRTEEARSQFAEALRIQPHFPEAQNNLGIAYMSATSGPDIANAEAAFRHAIADRPDYPDVLTNLGILLSQSNRSREGEEYLRQAISQDPHFVRAYVILANQLLSQGETSRAHKVIDDGLREMPNQPALLQLKERLPSMQ